MVLGVLLELEPCQLPLRHQRGIGEISADAVEADDGCERPIETSSTRSSIGKPSHFKDVLEVEATSNPKHDGVEKGDFGEIAIAVAFPNNVFVSLAQEAGVRRREGRGGEGLASVTGIAEPYTHGQPSTQLMAENSAFVPVLSQTQSNHGLDFGYYGLKEGDNSGQLSRSSVEGAKTMLRSSSQHQRGLPPTALLSKIVALEMPDTWKTSRKRETILVLTRAETEHHQQQHETGSRVAKHSRILLASLCPGNHRVESACYFPATFQGVYVTQVARSEEGEVQYSDVQVLPDAISVWGKCHERAGNNVLLGEQMAGSLCLRCFQVQFRSPNVIQVYTERFDKCHTDRSAAQATCPSTQAIHRKEAREITLFSRQIQQNSAFVPELRRLQSSVVWVRDMDNLTTSVAFALLVALTLSSPSPYLLPFLPLEIKGRTAFDEMDPVRLFCPIAGRYTFTYVLNDGNDDRRICPEPTSQMGNCPHGFGLTFQFRRCSFMEDMDLSYQCLGDWPGPIPGERVMALQDNQMTPASNRKPRFRCALYREDLDTGEISLSFSSDSTCSNDLFTASEGYETLALFPVEEPPLPRALGRSSCDFPAWMQGFWEDVYVNNEKLVYRDGTTFHTYNTRCVASLSDTDGDKHLIFARSQCGDQFYSCIWSKKRGMNVMEFQLSVAHSDHFNASLCDSRNFVSRDNWLTQGKSEVFEESPCPIAGLYSGFIPDATGLCARLSSDCDNPELMFYEVYNCNNDTDMYEGGTPPVNPLDAKFTPFDIRPHRPPPSRPPAHAPLPSQQGPPLRRPPTGVPPHRLPPPPPGGINRHLPPGVKRLLPPGVKRPPPLGIKRPPPPGGGRKRPSGVDSLPTFSLTQNAKPSLGIPKPPSGGTDIQIANVRPLIPRRSFTPPKPRTARHLEEDAEETELPGTELAFLKAEEAADEPDDSDSEDATTMDPTLGSEPPLEVPDDSESQDPAMKVASVEPEPSPMHTAGQKFPRAVRQASDADTLQIPTQDAKDGQAPTAQTAQLREPRQYPLDPPDAVVRGRYVPDGLPDRGRYDSPARGRYDDSSDVRGNRERYSPDNYRPRETQAHVDPFRRGWGDGGRETGENQRKEDTFPDDDSWYRMSDPKLREKENRHEDKRDPYEDQRRDPYKEQRRDSYDQKVDQYEEKRRDPYEDRRRDSYDQSRDQHENQRRDPYKDQRSDPYGYHRKDPYENQRRDQKTDPYDQRRNPYKDEKRDPYVDQRRDPYDRDSDRRNPYGGDRRGYGDTDHKDDRDRWHSDRDRYDTSSDKSRGSPSDFKEPNPGDRLLAGAGFSGFQGAQRGTDSSGSYHPFGFSFGSKKEPQDPRTSYGLAEKVEKEYRNSGEEFDFRLPSSRDRQSKDRNHFGIKDPEKKDPPRLRDPHADPRESYDPHKPKQDPYDRQQSRDPYDPLKPRDSYDPPKPRDPYDPLKPRDPYGPLEPQEPYDRLKSWDPYDREKPRDSYDPLNPRDPYVPPKPRDPYDRQKPSDPYDPLKPTDSYDRQKPRDPYDPLKPTDPYDPLKPRNPYDRQKPSDPYDPLNPRNPYDRQKPSDPYDPLKPRNSYDRQKHSDPYDPLRPRNPYDRQKPIGPYDPLKPRDPHDRQKPRDPHDPLKPTDLFDSLKPRNPYDRQKPSDPYDPLKPRDPYDRHKPRDPYDPLKPPVPYAPTTPRNLYDRDPYDPLKSRDPYESRPEDRPIDP
ncbi:unnamed protein product, partial [Cyprideis torosa]